MSDHPEGTGTAVETRPTETGQRNNTDGKSFERRPGRSQRGPGANEKYIQAVLDVERQADEIYANAMKEAEQLPKQAEQEAREILEKSRQEAQEEAHRISTRAQVQDESARIRTEAEEKVRRMKTSAASRMDMAVHFILDQIAGKE
jgi:vacuolar-type H+-ATPase subunit H